MPNRPLRTGCTLAALAAIAAAGCGPTAVYRPYFDQGGAGGNIDEYTYASEPHSPKTITILDLRTQEVVFAMDIPVGQQLVFNIDDKPANREEYMSGTMRWALMPAGNRYGSLSNRMPVPPPHSRRIDLTIRQGPELAVPPPVETMTPPPLSQGSDR